MILIFGYLGYGNYGDELLAKVLSEELLKDNAQEQIEYLSKKNSLSEHLSKLLRVKKIYAVGGMFQDLSSSYSPLYYFFVLLTAKILGKKIIIKAQGLGPLRLGFNRLLTRIIFVLADEVTVRNQYSSDLLTQWKVKHELVQDLAWSLKNKNLENLDLKFLEQLEFAGNEKVVFVCLKQLSSRGVHQSAARMDDPNASLRTGSVIHFCAELDCDVALRAPRNDIAFLEMQTGDHQVHQECLTELKKTNPDIKAYFIQAKDFRAEELIYIFKHYCSKLITMRFHARILAQIAGVEVKVINPDDDPKLEN